MLLKLSYKSYCLVVNKSVIITFVYIKFNISEMEIVEYYGNPIIKAIQKIVVKLKRGIKE